MKLLHLKKTPILEQLQLEEALLRASDESFCLINEGSPPAIVMGISGKPSELIALEKLQENPLPVVRRYSGGGTVVVDDDTLFVSFICRADLHPFAPYPEPIMRWSAELYKQVLKLPTFTLRENDYVLGEKKCGGNAQYLRKNRWVHHTTFLWDYQKERMDLLLHPKKTPTYRNNRPHEEFITPLAHHLKSKDLFVDSLKAHLEVTYLATEISLKSLAPILALPHRKSTTYLHQKENDNEFNPTYNNCTY
jgi:lipoate-protein ligase A